MKPTARCLDTEGKYPIGVTFDSPFDEGRILTFKISLKEAKRLRKKLKKAIAEVLVAKIKKAMDESPIPIVPTDGFEVKTYQNVPLVPISMDPNVLQGLIGREFPHFDPSILHSDTPITDGPKDPSMFSAVEWKPRALRMNCQSIKYMDTDDCAKTLLRYDLYVCTHEKTGEHLL